MLLFADPKYLYLLLLIPVFLVGYAVLRYLRGRRVKAFGDPALVEALMPSRSRSKGWVRMVIFCLAFLWTGARLAERTTRGAEIIVALDVSNSMLAEDYSPNRLERAKLSIARLTDRLQEDRIGLVIFAGTSTIRATPALIKASRLTYPHEHATNGTWAFSAVSRSTRLSPM